MTSKSKTPVLKHPKEFWSDQSEFKPNASPPPDIFQANAGAETLNESQPLAGTPPSNPQQNKGQIVFICGGDRDLTYWAVQVNIRPTANLSRRRGPMFEKPCCKNCNVAIYQNLKQAFWYKMGPWHRCLPFYGIAEVEEVKVCILLNLLGLLSDGDTNKETYLASVEMCRQELERRFGSSEKVLTHLIKSDKDTSLTTAAWSNFSSLKWRRARLSQARPAPPK